MKTAVLTIVLIFAANFVFASTVDTTADKQTDSLSKAKKKPFFHDLKIRQSFATPDEQQNPAQVMLSIPSSGRDNWLIDGGLSFDLGRISNLHRKWRIIGEFHRNTLVDSAQYNFQLGGSLSLHPTMLPNTWNKIWTIDLKFVRDVIKTNSSIAGTVNFAFYKPDGCIRLGIPANFDSDILYYLWIPSAEFQAQQYLGNDTHTAGIILRPTFNFPFTIGVNHGLPNGGGNRPRFFELALDYINRYAIVDATGDKEGYTKLLKSAVNYYLIDTGSKTASVGFGLNLGSDPINGLKAQKYWQLAVQVQL